MNIIYNFPALSVVFAMLTGIFSSALKKDGAKRLTMFSLTVINLMNIAALVFCIGTGKSYTYTMGQIPSPWGNEFRFGVLETLMAVFVGVLEQLILIGGMKHIHTEIADTKQNLYFLLTNLLLSSLLALIYTNDIFTAYVFIEINTIAAGGLIVIAQKGRTIVAGLRYMIMSLIGSGLLLFGLCILYDVTGHLLMEPCHEAIVQIFETGSSYETPLLIAVGLIGIGLCIKSALFPFSSWVPDAYGSSIAPSAAILSSLVSKGYIFLLIKICWRVVGYNYIDRSHLIDIFFVLGVIAMVVGSVTAIWETDIRRMIAYSSVAQIGYIYMGLGMGTKAGVIAACFHIISHGVTKALLFLAASDLSDASDRGRTFPQLRGAGLRNVPAGITFAIGALSMVGVPMLAGFTSKLLFAEAALDDNMVYTVITLIALAISTVLNVVYFLRTVITIYTPDEHHWEVGQVRANRGNLAVSLIMILLNFVLGLMSVPIVNLITRGLEMFS